MRGSPPIDLVEMAKWNLECRERSPDVPLKLISLAWDTGFSSETNLFVVTVPVKLGSRLLL